MAIRVEEYLKLIHRFPLRPIVDEATADEASDLFGEIGMKGLKLTEEEQHYLEILGALLKEYESKHLPKKRISPRRILKSFMEDHELSQSELARQIGTQQSVISEILSGKRGFSKEIILELSQRFCVRPDCFMQKKRTKRVARGSAK